jgi:hypothetical protein
MEKIWRRGLGEIHGQEIGCGNRQGHVRGVAARVSTDGLLPFIPCCKKQMAEIGFEEGSNGQ